MTREASTSARATVRRSAGPAIGSAAASSAARLAGYVIANAAAIAAVADWQNKATLGTASVAHTEMVVRAGSAATGIAVALAEKSQDKTATESVAA